MEEKYSVLMSVYSKEKPEYLRACIESMLNQTLFPNDFVIVKDGTLTEDLNSVINDYSKKYPDLFNIISLDENMGLGKALDKGMIYCRNEFIARMDSDDLSLPTRCEKQVTMFNQHPEYSIIGTMIDEFYNDPSEIISSRIVPTEFTAILKFIRKRNPFNHPTVMYKKSAVLDAGGYGGISTRQDLDLFSRMLNNGYKATNINEPLLLFRANENNFTRRKSWRYCKGDIAVRHKIWRRGDCTFLDFAITTVIFLIIWISPMWVLKFASIKFLRK